MTVTAITLILLLNASSDQPRELTNSLGMRLVPIAAGTLHMGQDGPQADYRMGKHPEKCDDADWDERPVHPVAISKPFLMAATEVTNAQYEQFDPQHRQAREKGRWSREPDEAVINVAWHDAMKFCQWLSAKEHRPYRLPTEAEWEYACRAGTTTLFHTGDRLPPAFTKWLESQTKTLGFQDQKPPPEYRDPPGPAPLRVGQTPANAWGLFDMHGNVEEWCLDWYGPYEPGDQIDPVGRSEGDFRVTRGGAHSQFARLLRSANRSAKIPEMQSVWTGFRVVVGEMPATRPLPPPPLPLARRNVAQTRPELPPVCPDSEKPYFQGPRPFVKIPPDSLGPLFSRHNHSPAIAECPNGDLLAVWFSCVEEPGTELCVAASRLRAGAAEWEEASPFWDVPDVNDHYPKLWFDGDKTLYFFAAGLTNNIVRTSQDSGATWSKPQPLLPVGELGNNPFRTQEGYLVIPHDWTGNLVISRDGGKTWSFNMSLRKSADLRPGATSVCCAGIHNAMLQRKDGAILGFGRLDKPEQQDLFDHHTPLSITTDWAKTWTYRESPFPVISSAQRAVLLRLREGPWLFCSFTDQAREWKNRKGMTFPDSAGGQRTGYGLFAALSYDEGETWPVRKLVTDAARREIQSTDGGQYFLDPTMAEPSGYLAICQTRDGMVQLISSKNHYVFNLAWLKQLPPP
jgi:sulfatase modifying factor 1